MDQAVLPGRAKALGFSLAFPASIVVLLISLMPILLLFHYSFNHFDPVDMMQSAFSLENYARFFGDTYYRQVFFNIVWVAAYVPCWPWFWAFQWRTFWQNRRAATKVFSLSCWYFRSW